MTSEEDHAQLTVSRDPRRYAELAAEFNRAAEAAATTAAPGQPERTWYDETSARLAESRRRWEEEVRLMREQFFSSTGRTEGGSVSSSGAGSSGGTDALKERAAALLDAHTFDQLYTHTTRRPDGRLGHRVRLDLRGFGSLSEASTTTASPPLQVTATVTPCRGPPRRVTVRVSGGSGGSRELVRVVSLPSGCVPNSLTACVTADGVLLIDAIVDDENLGSSSNRQQQQSGSTSSSSIPTPNASSADAAASTVSEADETPRIVALSDGRRLVRLQFRLGGGYSPSEVSVQVCERRLRVTARHEERSRGRSFFREFQRDCDLPDEVEPDEADASLTPSGLLIVEAPLSASSSSATSAAAAAAAALRPNGRGATPVPVRDSAANRTES